jgi:biotin carboxyl carrier protein
MTYDVVIDGTTYRVELIRRERAWECRLDGREVSVDAVLSRHDVLSIVMDGAAFEVKRELTPTDLHLWVGSARYTAEVRDPRSLRARREAAAGAQGVRKLVAPMPGRVVRVLVEEMSEVEAGQGIVVVEAMKMQNELKSPKKGLVKRILAAEGATVNAGEVLAIVE